MWALAAFAVVIVWLLVEGWQSEQSLTDFFGLGAVYVYVRVRHRWSSNGIAPVPKTGPAILVANHTCSADPAFLTAGCKRRLSFLIAQEYYRIPLLHRLFDFIHCVPVTRNGRDAASVRISLRRLEEGRVLCIFPEGGLSNAGRKRIRTGKAGVALLALRSRAPVFPALITGGPQTSNIRKAWLGTSRVHVIFASAIDLSAYYGRPVNRKLLEEVTTVIMNRIASLTDHQVGGFDEHCNSSRTDPQALRPVRGRHSAVAAT
jgi:1-acyl-sn-glycerol-3-phosphate acyltransferase